MYRIILIGLVFLIAYTSSIAQQVHHVKIGINGLHCSACSFSVEKSMQKLDFVRLIQMDLNERSGLVYLKEDQSFDIAALAQAVKDAGFSVRSLIVVFKTQIDENMTCVGDKICIVKKNVREDLEKEANQSRIRIIGKDFLERKEFKALEETLSSNCECTNEKALKAILL